jgi:hypothetical protein
MLNRSINHTLINREYACFDDICVMEAWVLQRHGEHDDQSVFLSTATETASIP